MARGGSGARAALCWVLGLAALGAGACSDNCCTVDSEPVPVSRAPLGGPNAGAGAILARARPQGGGAPFSMVVDTGSSVTILGAPPPRGGLRIQNTGFDLLDGGDPAPSTPRVRGRFRNLGIFEFPLGPVGDEVTMPGGVLGGDILHAFSVEMRFAAPCRGGAVGTCPTVTFWHHQGASQSFLEDAGYAVLSFNLFGGGETTASSQPDLLGLSAPVELPATRIVLNACAAPRAFSNVEPRELCCQRGDEITLATGIDLALMLATGVGPMVLSEQAWDRVAAALATAGTVVPEPTPSPLYIASWPLQIAARWTTLPRFALVNGSEPPSTGAEGPCVDLARARRLEWVAKQTILATPPPAPPLAHPEVAACVQPCDTDPSDPGKALNSAAYIELAGEIPVAIVSNDEPYLQSLRFDIRTEGPDIDGVVGAAALGAARVEIDYLNSTPRAIFSCETGTPAAECYVASRCPRLPDHTHDHLCFGLPEHGLPVTCEANGCGM